MSDRALVAEQSVPRLPTGVRLKFDKPRDQWVVLAPERMFQLDAVAHEIVKRCDGAATVAAIADELAAAFEAPREVILKDVVALLQGFVDKRVIVV
jgi:pyrroloquinoline quinone biosynthesis protein D